MVFQEKEDPGVSKDSWETQESREVWATEARRDPKETEDSRVPLVLWDPQGLQESPRRSLSSPGRWVHREKEAPQAHRERWDPKVPQENQVYAGIQGRPGPREEAVCLPRPDSEESWDPWGTRGQSARRGSQAAQGPPACPACLAAVSALATSW